MNDSKPYPRIDEEDGSVMTANEPIGAVAYADEATKVDFRPIPGLPQTWDELLECLEEGEKEIERGEYIPGEEVFKSVRERIKGYAS